MTLLVNAADECFFIYEGAGAGHVLPPYNGPWTLLGEVVYNADVDQNTIFVTRYPDLTPTGWAGLYLAANGSDLILETQTPAGRVVAAAYALTPATRYPVSLHYSGSAPGQRVLTFKLDGVVIRQITGVELPAGTAGQLSAQWAGFGAGGHTNSTWARWRMWGADLTEAECKAEHRSYTPVRTADLVSDWPMLAGATRYADTVGSNTLIPNGAITDGADIPLMPLSAARTEALSFSDSYAAQVKVLRTVVESITFSDTQAALGKFKGALSESITLTDSVASSLRQAGIIAESITFTDSQTAVHTSGVINVETITFSDSVDGVLHAVTPLVESLTFADIVTAAAASENAVVETLTFTDLITGLGRGVREVVETLSFVDSVVGVARYPAALQEAITFTDSQSALAPSESGVVEQLVFQDAVVAKFAGLGVLAEDITFTDIVQASGGPVPPTPANTGGGWAPQLPQQKRKRDRVLDDLLAAIEELDPPKAQERKARQAVHRIVREAQPNSVNEFIANLDMAKLEARLEEVIVKAARKAKKAKQRRDDELIMLMM